MDAGQGAFEDWVVVVIAAHMIFIKFSLRRIANAAPGSAPTRNDYHVSPFSHSSRKKGKHGGLSFSMSSLVHSVILGPALEISSEGRPIP